VAVGAGRAVKDHAYRLPPPPPEQSAAEHVFEIWKVLLRDLRDGNSIRAQIEGLEHFLTERHQRITSGSLPSDFNWEFDLGNAISAHRRFLILSEEDLAARENWKSFWRQRIQANDEFALKLMSDVLKFTLLANGATAIAALSALTSTGGETYKSALLMAMFGAVISIIALTLGEIILIETVSSFTNKIKGRLSNKDGWRTLQAIAVYGSRHYGKYQRAAEFLIYGSLAWFCVYILICLLMIADI
jgi:hypothetical protein